MAVGSFEIRREREALAGAALKAKANIRHFAALCLLLQNQDMSS